ncbi:hypothetical protein NTGHW29_360015 [Candidatus Nitrotoga sp. HW29]|nr:hypothetical protein NTGHW29_360015 [Candidatus Nitrotoga sp. HW29]
MRCFDENFFMVGLTVFRLTNDGDDKLKVWKYCVGDDSSKRGLSVLLTVGRDVITAKHYCVKGLKIRVGFEAFPKDF